VWISFDATNSEPASMRLINVSTLRLETFNNETTIPPYAILSHTWSDSEVTFHDFSSLVTSKRRGHILSSAGYYKIAKTCEQALSEGLAYAWVDTCCIDQKSSAELTESINSMFRWYSNAQICYAFLDDIDMFDPMRSGDVKFAQENEGMFWDKSIDLLDEKDLTNARWFTRGWTLQELIAPMKIAFYIKGWKYVGNKSSMRGKLARITGVNERMLKGFLPNVSVAERMNWAARRETTKGEDMAYCLLGIFDVSMPLLYGEGAEKAFIRLQEEIMKDSDDQSLFAWQSVTPPRKREWGLIMDNDPVASIFAPHPQHFSGFASHSVHPSHLDSLPYALTNIGVRMRIPVLALDLTRAWYLLVLNCCFEKSLGLQVGIAVKKLPGSTVARFARLDSVGLFKVVRSGQLAERVNAQEVYLCKKISWSLLAGEGQVEQLDVPHARDFLFLTKDEVGAWGKRWSQADQSNNLPMSDSDTELNI
jgi:hypothetical protein